MPCPIKVAIVDDIPIYLNSLRYALKRYPQVEVMAEGHDGIEAIEVARDHAPDVMLMDVAMPNMNGLDATREIGRLFPKIRIIILSMHAEHMEARAIEAGAYYCLGKETRVVDLVVKIQICVHVGVA